MNSNIFKAGGPLFLEDSNIYIERQADQKILQHISKMEYILCIEPRQQGKTSLVKHLKNQLDMQNTEYVYIDITALNKSSEVEWYNTLCEEILFQLKDFIPVEQKPAIPENYSKWRIFLRDIAIKVKAAKKRLIIALDEIGAVSFPKHTEFFSILRNIFNSRDDVQGFKNITFILVGAFHPKDLIEDDKISPFNVAHRVRLNDFSYEQVKELISKGNWLNNQTDELAQQIFDWTGGQPYLTQLICSALKPTATPVDVDTVVKVLLQEDSNHLPALRDRLEKNNKLNQYAQQILLGKSLKFYPEQQKQQKMLELLGLIKPDEADNCIIKNPIYERILTPLPQKEQSTDFEILIDKEGIIEARSSEGERNGRMTTKVPNEIELTLQLIENKQTNK